MATQRTPPAHNVLIFRIFPAIAGAKVLFGGKPLEGHTIPACYGAIQPTAIFVPLKQMLDPKHFPLVTTEVFGPFQVTFCCW